MKKKTIWVPVLLSLGIMILGGCGTKQAEQEAETSVVETTETATQEEQVATEAEVTEEHSDDDGHDHSNDDLSRNLETQAYDGKLRVVSLRQGSAFGLAKLLQENAEENEDKYEFMWEENIVSLQQLFSAGNADVALVATTVAADLNRASNNQLQLIGVNSLNTFYIVEKGNKIIDFSALQGQTMMISGIDQGIGEILNTIAQENGMKNLEAIDISWEEVPSKASAAVEDNKTVAAVLPEPYATIAVQEGEARIAIDIGAEWARVTGGDEMPLGAIVTTRKFAEQHPEVIDEFLNDYAESTAFTNEKPTEAATILASHGVWNLENQIVKSIPQSNLVLLKGTEMKESVSEFLNILAAHQEFEENRTIPDDGFYYIGE